LIKNDTIFSANFNQYTTILILALMKIILIKLLTGVSYL
jgi:hypothetical protein